MNVKRGDVVLVDYPFGTGESKVRPALIVQNDRDNHRLVSTIIVQVTSLTRRALEPTQVLIEIATPDGRQSGLRQDSVVNCVNLLTLNRGKVLRTIGSLSTAALLNVDAALRAALDLR